MNMADLLSYGWEYRGEGNANVAIALHNINKILKIPKREKPRTTWEWFINWIKEIFKWEHKEQIRKEKKNLDFYNLVMVPFFGETYAQPAIAVTMYPSIIKKLEKEMMSFRPEHRKHKLLQVWSASLVADYSFLPKHLTVPNSLHGDTLSIEIKPKQGWVPESERHYNKCMFCSNQYLKLKRGQIAERSSYCPLDLFSGDKKRIVKAFKALICSPRNNLRIFKNGTYCYGEHIAPQYFEQLLCQFYGCDVYQQRLLESFCSVLQQSVVQNFDVNAENTEEEYSSVSSSKDKCSFTQSKLPDGCILDKILKIQKLNHLGLDSYKEMYEEQEQLDAKIDEWSYVDALLQQHSDIRLFYNKSKPNELQIVPYLLAAVANDCSFMITLRKVNHMTEGDSRNHLISDGINNFVVNIGVFDLYPKSALTIKRHAKRNASILKVISSNN